jgi:hypothetical protein
MEPEQRIKKSTAIFVNNILLQNQYGRLVEPDGIEPTTSSMPFLNYDNDSLS